MAYSGYENTYRVATSLQRPRITRIRCIHLYRWKADVLGLSGARIIPDIYNRRDTYCIYSQYSKKKKSKSKKKERTKEKWSIMAQV